MAENKDEHVPAPLDETQPDTAARYDTMANDYECKGEHDRALEYYTKALDIYVATLGDTHPRTTAVYRSMAEVHMRKGDYGGAIMLYGKGMNIVSTMSDTPDSNDEWVMVSKNLPQAYGKKAYAYETKGEYDQALNYYLMSLSIVQARRPGSGKLLAAHIFENMARVHGLKGEHEKALDFYFKALDIFVHIELDPAIATVYSNIASVYGDMGEYDKALKCFEKSLVLTQGLLGDRQPDAAAIYNRMADVYQKKGDPDRAREMSNKAAMLVVEHIPPSAMLT